MAALFYLAAALAVIFTGMVILLRNPVTSALSLVASFFCVSVLFVLLQAPLLAVIQILIYAGAVLVLFLYVLMLLDLEPEEPAWGRIGRILRPAALGIVPLLLIPLLPLLKVPDGGDPFAAHESFGSLRSVGKNLLGPHALVFEALSLILLVGMVGVILLAPRKGKGAS
jgi:NADH-quinone oxidoreductase subunit J